MKSLDTISNIVPDYEPNWEASIALPEPYRDGLFVAVFTDASHSQFVCYGQIIGREANELVDDYRYDIQICQSKSIIDSWGWAMMPASPEAMRMGWVAIEGGFPEFARKS